RPSRDGSDTAKPVVILSVGRAVEKKGFADLLEALASLAPDLAWRFVHIGGGPLLGALKAKAEQLGIASRAQWQGAGAQKEVLAALRAADFFALASRVARGGDRDGLAHVLLGAARQRLAIAATRCGAIGEFIRDDETGLLVPAGDSSAMSKAIGRLITDPALRARLGGAAQARLVAEFDAVPAIARLAAKFAPAR